MNSKRLIILIGMLTGLAPWAFAQTEDPLASAAIKQALASPARHIEGIIVAIDPATRTLTLKGAKDNIVSVTVGKEVVNFNTLALGDRVDVSLKNAMLIKAIRTGEKDEGVRKRVETDVYAPASDGLGYGSVHQMELLATIQRIDRKNKTITLRGPWKTETLVLTPEVAADNVKAGDTIRAIFITAVAVEVTRKPQ